MMSKHVWAGCLSSLAFVMSTAGYAASGDLDPTFDTDGIVITDFDPANHDQIQGVAIDGSGRIVVAGFRGSATNGNFAIARYNADGSLDATFDTDGLVEQAFSATGDVGNAVAIDSNGKIVVAGTVAGRFGNSEIGVARFNADGSLDTTFDTDGLVITDIGSIDQGYAMAVQADNKIVVAGAVDNVITVVRYNTDGSLDATFDTDGIASGAAAQTARAVAIDGSGNIVVAGYTANTASADFILQRFTPIGALDAAFGAGGTVTTDFGASKDQAYSVAVDGSGRIVAAGYSGGSFAVARYTASGVLDTTFDTDGLVTTDASGGNDIAYSLAIDGDGKIVAGGIFTSNFGIARYNDDGSLDTTFTPTGLTQADVAGGGLQDHAYAMALDANGFIVMAGRAFSSVTSRYNFAVARFEAVAVPPQDFGDAPAGYPTLLADDGARHTIDPAGPYLGIVNPDAEADGQSSANADGDDVVDTDDEDGLTAAPNLRTSLSTTVSVDVTVPTSASLNAWIDWNQDGDWSDLGEQIADDVAAVDGNNLLAVDVPADAALGTTAARFRVCSTVDTCDTPTGLAPDGEVEDHMVTVTSGEPGTFYFDSSTVYANEGDGTVTVYVGRTNGSGGAVSVEYLMRSGTAIEARTNRRGVPQGDYFKSYGVVSWADNDTSLKPITIDLADDLKAEGTEEFYVVLHIANGGAIIGDPSTVTVVIYDND